MSYTEFDPARLSALGRLCVWICSTFGLVHTRAKRSATTTSTTSTTSTTPTAASASTVAANAPDTSTAKRRAAASDAANGHSNEGTCAHSQSDQPAKSGLSAQPAHSDEHELVECSNFTLLNFVLYWTGPLHERTLTVLLLLLQVHFSLLFTHLCILQSTEHPGTNKISKLKIKCKILIQFEFSFC